MFYSYWILDRYGVSRKEAFTGRFQILLPTYKNMKKITGNKIAIL